MKATSSQLKSFLRTCKNAYVTIDLGNGPMMVKVIKSAMSEAISSEEYSDSMWHYEFMQTDTGLDLKLGENLMISQGMAETEEDSQEETNESMSYNEEESYDNSPVFHE